MKIIDNREKTNLTCVKDMTPGEVYQLNSEFYIVTSAHNKNGFINTVNLTNGQWAPVPDYTCRRLVKGHIVIED